MRFGTYHVFQCPPGQDPARVVREELARAELADALGFDDVWVPEQHFSPYCLAGDALLLAGHLAARTRRVRVGTAVVNLTFTHPLRFAERVALLDHASGGRVDVGIGRGYQFPQYGVFGVPIDETRAVFDEALDVVLRAWSGDEFTYDGTHFRTVARDALEWDLSILQQLTTPTTREMPRGYALYEQRGGRLPEYTYDDWVENVLLFDDPDGCAKKIARLRDAGVERLILWMGVGGMPHELVERSMRLFAESVAPRFR